MRRSIPHGCVARRLNSLLFALLAFCHAGAPTPENVNLFLGEPLGTGRKFKSFFPEYADRRVIGAVAGIVIDGGADRFCIQERSVCDSSAQTGDTVRILNDKGFMPKEW